MVLQAPKRFPGFLDEVRDLVEHHKKVRSGPLVLSVYYDPQRPNEPDDVFMLDAFANYEDNGLEKGDLFEVSYGPTGSFPMAAGESLHVIIANPEQLKSAVKLEWPLAMELRRAVRAGNYTVMAATPEGEELLEAIRG
jgi:hypothetical protein